MNIHIGLKNLHRYAYAVCKTTFEEGFDYCGFATFRMSLYVYGTFENKFATFY